VYKKRQQMLVVLFASCVAETVAAVWLRVCCHTLETNKILRLAIKLISYTFTNVSKIVEKDSRYSRQT
jgi:hypothetical protein